MKRFLSLVLCVMMMVGIPASAFAEENVNGFSKAGGIQPTANRYYYVIEAGIPVVTEIPLSSTSPTISGFVWTSVAIAVGAANTPAGITAAVIQIGSYLYNFNLDGKLVITKTEYRKYQVDRLTGKRTYIPRESYSKVHLEGYAYSSSGLIKVRDYSHTLHNK